jgi:CheY-like chemotaxis protein
MSGFRSSCAGVELGVPHPRLASLTATPIISVVLMTEDKSSKIPRRILVADDNRALQQAVKRVGERRGHEILHAITGAGTLIVAAESQPDVIVLDMDFPDADGRDILRKLKSDERTAHIPVVVWSGRDGHISDSRISLDLGAEDFVEKTDAHLLVLKLERVLLRLDQEN